VTAPDGRGSTWTSRPSGSWPRVYNSWTAGALVGLFLLAMEAFIVWLLNHSGMRLVDNCIRRSIGCGLTDLLGFRLYVVLYIILVVPSRYGIDRIYRVIFRLVASEDPPTKEPGGAEWCLLD
jgi:hypothetical protein